MNGKLRLGPLPRNEVVRLTVALLAPVKADLDRYAELYGANYGEVVDAAALIPHMIAAFMERDRAFRRARQDALIGSLPSTASASIDAAASSANAIAPEDSSSTR